MAARRNVYLDHSASTPVDARVIETMLPYFSEVYVETGAVVPVPPFIEPGEIIRVDTREAKYLERVNK